MELKNLRLKTKTRPEELAKIMCISLQAYYKYEKGTNEPNIENLCKLADFYNVSLDYLVSREKNNDIGYLTPKQISAVKLLKLLNEENLIQEIGRLSLLVEMQ